MLVRRLFWAMMGPVRPPLRRSFSEHVKDSTNKAWDVFWRSVRDTRLWEIEAREACDWLRAAGFPQYVQLFREGEFPIDLDWAKQDHLFLDKDAVDSLCRRLNTLNKRAELRLEPRRSKTRDIDGEDEDFGSISPNWTYDRTSKRWRHNTSRSNNTDSINISNNHANSYSSCSSDSECQDGHNAKTPTGSSLPRFFPMNRPRFLDTSFSKCPSPGSNRGGSSGSVSLEGSLEKQSRKKGTSLLKKIDKLKFKKTNGSLGLAKMLSTGMGLSLESPAEQNDMDRLQCSESPQSAPNSPASSCPSSPQTFSSQSESSSTSQSGSSSVVSTPSPVARVRSNSKRGLSTELTPNDQVEDFKNHIHLSHPGSVLEVPSGHKPGTFPTSLSHNHSLLSAILDHSSVNWRTGSFHGYQRRGSGRRHGTSSLAMANQSAPSGEVIDHRLSLYDNVQPLSESDGSTGSHDTEVFARLRSGDMFSALDTVLERINDLQQLVSSWTEDLSEEDLTQDSPSPTSKDHIQLEIHQSERREEQSGTSDRTNETGTRSRVKRSLSWSSDPSLRPDELQTLTWSTMGLLQKLSLLKLTALMDKYSPSSKQGWSWTVPKPPRKTKVPEFKGRRVFGVPLLVNMQQTGEPLPPSVLRALVYLRNECLDQEGLFRRSGVKTRIQSLREQLESAPGQLWFRGQSAFDVADLVKQYFRDLPEPVFTSTLSETFLHIYQYFPKEQQLGAVQAAILLLPDENREALRTLLYFLSDVVTWVEENHMTPTNIAVCLAPSLFRLSTIRRDNQGHRSGHRKYSLGRPDQRDLSENLAATQGLAHMISEAHRLFTLPVFYPSPTSCPSEKGAWPDTLKHNGDGAEGEELTESRLKLEKTTQVLLKLSQDQDQTWDSLTTPDGLQLDYRRSSDLSPVPLWRATLEMDVPPAAVLKRILTERAQFDPRLHRDCVVRPLTPDSDLFQYQIQSQGHELGSIPPTQHLLIRCWQSDPSSGPLYVSSMSIHHQDVPSEGVRANVHCCLYLLEPTGDKNTRLTHLCATEYRGRTLEWHSKVGGYLLSNELLSIQDSFKHEINNWTL